MGAFRQAGRRGAALMLSLWALFLLSAVVISWALDIGARLALSGFPGSVIQFSAPAVNEAPAATYIAAFALDCSRVQFSVP